jgi:hypothetical protein
LRPIVILREMRGRQVAHPLVARIVVAAVAIAACQPTTPTAAPIPSAPLRPSIAPSTTAAPNPTNDVTISGDVRVDVRLIGGPLDGRFGPTGVWTGSEVLIWGGVFLDDFFNGPWHYRRSGAAYDPASDDWREISRAPIRGRYRHLAAWTGREMLVWGGFTASRSAGAGPDGAAYDPQTNRWRTIAPAPLRGMSGTTAVMTDSEWVVARATRHGIRVAAYDPEADSWRLLPSIPGDLSDENRLIWTAADLVLMNVADGMYRLEPDADAWMHSGSSAIGWDVVWTGAELLAAEASWLGDGLVRYDPIQDAWQEIAGPALVGGRLVWTGTNALVLADHGDPSYLYNPGTDVWREITIPRRLGVEDQVSTWTSSGLVEWGGWHGGVGAESYDAGWVLQPNPNIY